MGTALGVLAGGTVRNLGNRRFAFAPLLAAAVLAQVVAAVGDGGVSAVALVASYVLLVAFAAANLRVVGMGLVVVGTAMNLAVIAANGSMPVRPQALVAAGIAQWEEIPSLEFGAKRHLEGPRDRLAFLGDIVPVPVLRQVLSFGDLVLAVGAADVIANLVRSPRRRRRRAPAHRIHARVPRLS